MLTEFEQSPVEVPVADPAVADDDKRDCNDRLPESFVAMGAVAHRFRGYLVRKHPDRQWKIFKSIRLDGPPIEGVLDALGEPDAQWDAGTGFDAMFPGASPATMGRNISGPKKYQVYRPGFLSLPSHSVVVMRWMCLRGDGYCEHLNLFAAPTVRAAESFVKAIAEALSTDRRPCWQLLGCHGNQRAGDDRIKRRPAAGHLILPQGLRDRLEREAYRFFSPGSQQLHDQLGVPYRKGILLYGPPGCGKTTICRDLGALESDASAFLLRPASQFDDDDLECVFQMVNDQAPSLLVLEDVDLLLRQSQVSVSNLLNILDGVTVGSDSGVLVVATTNRPKDLDAALNDRPGRFTAIEVPSPDLALRLQYLRTHLRGAGDELIGQIGADTCDLSYAHLHEIVKISGLLAMEDARETRTPDDVREAARLVVNAHASAEEGFRRYPQKQFGFNGDSTQDSQ